MCKRHGEKAEKTPNETEIERQPKSATPKNHEDCPQHQDLELATLRCNACEQLYFDFGGRGDRLESDDAGSRDHFDWCLCLHRCLFKS
jgi:hypothetical protein